jgi:exopolyphosphatase/guanosine-5'-triphosphate,3'-diphosphate pyrophosphatase
VKFAAVDMGSNAVRLLLAQVFEGPSGPVFKKEALVRMPLRLGDDAFLRREISPDKAWQLIKTLSGFRCLMDAYQPLAYRAVATSAMREARNGPILAGQIHDQCGLRLEIISGEEEGSIIFANHFEQRLEAGGAYLYLDVGGGSTELTLFGSGCSTASASFDIGTVRLLDGMVPETRWREMKAWITAAIRGCPEIQGIGSGGNINKIFRLSGRKEGQPITPKHIRATHARLSALSFEARIRELGLRPDRADVIVPAARIYLSVLRWAGIRRMYVPQIGLADGLVHQLYEQHRSRESSLADPGAAGSPL